MLKSPQTVTQCKKTLANDLEIYKNMVFPYEKEVLCRFYLRGTCPLIPSFCKYAHGINDLQYQYYEHNCQQFEKKCEQNEFQLQNEIIKNVQPDYYYDMVQDFVKLMFDKRFLICEKSSIKYLDRDFIETELNAIGYKNLGFSLSTNKVQQIIKDFTYASKILKIQQNIDKNNQIQHKNQEKDKLTLDGQQVQKKGKENKSMPEVDQIIFCEFSVQNKNQREKIINLVSKNINDIIWDKIEEFKQVKIKKSQEQEENQVQNQQLGLIQGQQILNQYSYQKEFILPSWTYFSEQICKQSLEQFLNEKFDFREEQNGIEVIKEVFQIKEKNGEKFSKQQILQEFIDFDGNRSVQKIFDQIIEKKMKKNGLTFIMNLDDIEKSILSNEYKAQKQNLRQYILNQGFIIIRSLNINFLVAAQIFQNKNEIEKNLKFLEKSIAKNICKCGIYDEYQKKKIEEQNQVKEFFEKIEIEENLENEFFEKTVLVVDDFKTLRYAMKIINKQRILAVDQEGWLDLIQIGVQYNYKGKNIKQQFIFDLYKVIEQQKEKESNNCDIDKENQNSKKEIQIYDCMLLQLQQVFEDKVIEKIFHACRQDSELINRKLNCCIKNIFDTSTGHILIEYLKDTNKILQEKIDMYDNFGNDVLQEQKIIKQQIKLCQNIIKQPGFNLIMENYDAENGISEMKDDMHKRFKDKKVFYEFFYKRPIDQELIEYSAKDVEDLVQVSLNMKLKIQEQVGIFLKLLRILYQSGNYQQKSFFEQENYAQYTNGLVEQNKVEKCLTKNLNLQEKDQESQIKFELVGLNINFQ
ncbi:Ribonuclease H-like domain [Pseudocohnilembus persalinus]|uniref:Ribonuclease H-like domain n=1 Tax=Pseudocohnilembus persalinus TaxID=266149 RepID=A0A0V0QTI4_PSEPJ|nr:Ribonuclease H-like domain [Pseudocohnilembus persalinus]|eukprot:KRX05290.1 Ribonuclease H-like domain [Pseudocohnilembus persalinus]